jgi:hypothetical protein
MIRPWYRSRLFWLGLPGLAFLLWAGWDSERNFSEMAWVKPKSVVSVYLSGGRLCGVVTEEAPVPAFSGPRLQFQREEGPRGGAMDLLFGGELARREREARRYFAPGVYRLRWSFRYLPTATPTAQVTSSSRLIYREWGVEWWLVVAGYGLLLSLALVAWQRRKVRLLILHSAPPP